MKLKFAILSGAYKNAGDFLIVSRSKELIQKVYPDSELLVYERKNKLDDVLGELNSCDAIVLAGGPLYLPEVYPNVIPLVDNLDLIKTKIVTLGCGWSGYDDSNECIFNEYIYSSQSVKLFKRIIKDGTKLSCRDWYSTFALKNNNLSSYVMTGCPAWYDLNYVNEKDMRTKAPGLINKICISDPAYMENIPQALNVSKYLKEKYPMAKINFVFHRGISADQFTDKNTAENYVRLKNELEIQGIEICNIAYSDNGFKIYDDCDLHIGFRVHAHIYNLSRRNLSILIEEDGRGAGVNQTLGLMSIKSYENNRIRIFNEKKPNILSKCLTKIHGKHIQNPYLVQNLDNYLELLNQSNYLQIKNAYKSMRFYYNEMIKHIEGFVE